MRRLLTPSGLSLFNVTSDVQVQLVYLLTLSFIIYHKLAGS